MRISRCIRLELSIGVMAMLYASLALADSVSSHNGESLNEPSRGTSAEARVGGTCADRHCANDLEGQRVLGFDWSGGIGEYERISVDGEFCHNPFDFPRRPVTKAHLLLDLSQVFESQTDMAAHNESVYGWRGGKVTFKQSALSGQIGRPDNIEELIRRLLGAVRELSPYDLDVEMPAVHSLPLKELHLRLCGRPCTIRAAYVPGDGQYMDEMMRPLSNQYDQSILFHELVHHVQEVASSHVSDNDC